MTEVDDANPLIVCAVERTVLVSITRVSFAPTVTEEIYATSLNKIEAVIAAAVVLVIEILVLSNKRFTISQLHILVLY